MLILIGVEGKSEDDDFKRLEWKGSPKDIAHARRVELTKHKEGRVMSDDVAEIWKGIGLS